MLNVQLRQLAVQEQQLVAQQISAVQLRLQTQMMHLTEVRTQQQRAMKAAAFALKAEVEKAKALASAFVRACKFLVIDDMRQSAGIEADALEELADKEYLRALETSIRTETDAALASLSEPDRTDSEWLVSGEAWAIEQSFSEADGRAGQLRGWIAHRGAELGARRDAQASAFERALPTAAGGAGGVTLGFGAGFLFDAMIGRPTGSALALLCAMPAAIAAAILGLMAYERSAAARRARDGSVAAARHAWAEVQAWQHELQGLDAVAPDLAANLDQAKQRLAAIVARHPEVTGLGLLPP